jgi:hypothetical protein
LNLPNFLDQEVALEVSLRRVLTNWSQRQKPPSSVRATLMERVSNLKQGKLAKFNVAWKDAQRLPHSSSLLYLHQWRFVSIWMNF